MLLSALAASLLPTLLSGISKGKGVIRDGNGVIRAGEGTNKITAGFLMQLHPLTNFETQKYYQNEFKFNGVYSRNNLPKIKDWAYVMNRDEYKSIGNYWTALYIEKSIDVTYFDSFWVEHIPKEIKKFISNKNTITNIHRIQA